MNQNTNLSLSVSVSVSVSVGVGVSVSVSVSVNAFENVDVHEVHGIADALRLYALPNPCCISCIACIKQSEPEPW